MIKYLGLDIGNITTVYTTSKKTSIIESRLKEATEVNKLSGSSVLKNNDKEYLVGEGYFENNTFKYRKPSFINLLHYSVADAFTDNSTVNLVIGIPVQQFTQEYKKELAQIIRNNKNIDVKINDKRKRVTIERILIRPESYGVFKLFQAQNKIKKNVPTLVIDIGGGTTDLSSYNNEGKFIEGTSINEGLLKFYEIVKENIFKVNGSSLTIEEVKEYTRGNFSLIGLEDNLYLAAAKITFDEIYNNILGKYKDIEKYNIIISGGGGEIFGKYFKEKINHVLIDYDITTNSKTFYQIALQEFEK
jgi:hypothetical protein